MAIWLDLEDLVRFFHHFSRPTGIQRLSFEVCRELSRLDTAEGTINFCRHAPSASGFRAIDFAALEGGILAAASSGQETAPIYVAVHTPQPPPRIGRAPDSLVMRVANSGRRLPPQFRRPLGIIGRSVVQILDALPDLARAAKAEITPFHTQRVQIGEHEFDLEGDEVVFAPGDWLVELGASWETPFKPGILAHLKENGVRLALLTHDLIPELFPEWAVKQNIENYRTWLRTNAPVADQFFAVSQSTANDLTACVRALGYEIRPPVVLPVGSVAPVAPDPEVEIIPATRPYVLIVSTIEIRKNHILLFRIWRRMLREMPAEQVPDLVFAGKIGWLTADLMQQLENSDWLDGRIRFVASPSDSVLAALYRGCLFTVFPSLYEGWGLPVTESLSYGKTVAASDRASIPEAGGKFCAYFDPENLGAADAVIRGLIQHPERIAVLEAKIKAHFAPPGWSDTAAVLYGALMPAAYVLSERAESLKVAAD